MSDLPEVITHNLDVVIDNLDRWLSSRSYNHRKYILPEYFSDDCSGISYDAARVAMYCAVRVGVLKTNYEIYCPRCGERVDVVHREMDIPDSMYCEDCNYTFNPWDFQELILISFALQEQGPRRVLG